MPVIARPQSNAQREAALRNAKNRKDSVPPPPEIPYMPGTIAKLDIFQPAYRAKYLAVSSAKNQQTGITGQIAQARKLAIYNELDFIDNLNKAIRRGIIQAARRSLYQIDVNDNTQPTIRSENDIITWGQNITDGEAARLLLPGEVPVTFPSVADVNAAVGNFNTLNLTQANAKDNLNIAQEALEAENVEADKFILKLWNETETAFDQGDKASMRNRAREWGVVYVPSPGEAPSPDDFSIMGKVTEAGTGTELNEVEILVVETSTVVLSDSDGDYFVGLQPPATYTLQVSKAGYQAQTITGVVVTAGVINTVNIQLSVAVATGTVAGNVKQGGVNVQNATIAVVGMTLPPIFTDINGNFSISNVPVGVQQVIAQLPASPTSPHTQNVNVLAGLTATVSFNF